MRKQLSLHSQKRIWNHYLRHGGELRKKRAGRGSRPLSTKEPLHLVFKVDKSRLKRRSLRFSEEYRLCLKLAERYARKFFVKVEQISVQNDHIHLLIRTSKRSQFQNFFRVLAGQIAQEFTRENLLAHRKVTDTPNSPKASGARCRNGTSLWLSRPFSRIVRGWKAYQTARNYVGLNELEVRGMIPYRKERLRGLSAVEWELLDHWLGTIQDQSKTFRV